MVQAWLFLKWICSSGNPCCCHDELGNRKGCRYCRNVNDKKNGIFRISDIGFRTCNLLHFLKIKVF